MLSLTRAINRIDREERLYQAAIDCYLAALSHMLAYPLETEPEIVRAFAGSVQRIRGEITGTHEPAVLESSKADLAESVRSYFSNASAVAEGKAEDLRIVIAALAEAASLLGRQHAGQADKLRQFTSRLQATERAPDIAQMRRQIVSHVADLRAIGDTAQKESDATLAELHSRLAEFGRRLDEAEQRASLDSLTNLLNRGEGEARLGRIVKSGRSASAILIDLDGFKKINDTWGHTAGDQVLKTCARKLNANIRPGDLVCRWGGDEFLIILRCGEEVARERARRLKENLRSIQKIVVLGKIIEIPVSASLGVAGVIENELPVDFVARVDADMYRDKAGKAAAV